MKNIEAWAKNMIIIDHTSHHERIDPMYYFAYDELLCKLAGEQQLSFCHLWKHPAAFILGQQDARLPYVQNALEYVQQEGYHPLVRHSGGAAVPLDQEVINLSLIFPKMKEARTLNEDFERMFQLIKQALAKYEADVQTGEIYGAYCPGEYDLSINGYKFCGIAQRRQLNGYCIQAFNVVLGDGKERAALVKKFYQRATNDEPALKYPHIIEEKTASLAQLLEWKDQSVALFLDPIVETLEANGAILLSDVRDTSTYKLPTSIEITQKCQQLYDRYR